MEENPLLDVLVQALLILEDSDKYNIASQTNAERVRTVTAILERRHLLPREKIVKKKTKEESLQLRQLGNKAFLNGDFKEARKLYTKSIATAPFPTEEELKNGQIKCEGLGIAFANRSVVLFRDGKYESCLKDIGQALKYKYPERLLYKLYELQGKCLHQLGRKEKAVESLNVSNLKTKFCNESA